MGELSNLWTNAIQLRWEDIDENRTTPVLSMLEAAHRKGATPVDQHNSIAQGLQKANKNAWERRGNQGGMENMAFHIKGE